MAYRANRTGLRLYMYTARRTSAYCRFVIFKNICRLDAYCVAIAAKRKGGLYRDIGVARGGSGDQSLREYVIF